MSKKDETTQKLQAAGRVCRKGALLDHKHPWCDKGARALVRNRHKDLVEITILEWSISGLLVKVRYELSGIMEWIDSTLGEYVLEELLATPPVDVREIARAPRPKSIPAIEDYDLLWAMLSQALDDEKAGKVMRSFSDHHLIEEACKFFSVEEDERVKAMVEADDGEAGYERCRHMLKAAMRVRKV